MLAEGASSDGGRFTKGEYHYLGEPAVGGEPHSRYPLRQYPSQEAESDLFLTSAGAMSPPASSNQSSLARAASQMFPSLVLAGVSQINLVT